MNTTNTARNIVQVTGWKNENRSIPEEHITQIVKSSLNMQTGQYTAFLHNGIHHGTKPFKIWIPHREGELENVLSLAGIHSIAQNQDQVFHNVKNVIVYLVTEPDHISEKKELAECSQSEDDFMSWMCVKLDPQMNWKIKQDWDGYNKFINELLSDEKVKRKEFRYNEKLKAIVPFHNFHGEHLTAIYSALGMAMGTASLQTQALGYHTQFHTAYRATVAWRDFYGNKFHSEGKWYPHVLQIIGTHPRSAKSNPYRTLISDSVDDVSSLINPNDLHNFSEKGVPNFVNDNKFDVMDPNQHSVHLRKDLTDQPVPEYQKEFFQKHYGRYSSDPKKLFERCYRGKARIA